MPNSVCSFGAIKYIAVSMEMHQKLDELQLTGVCVCVCVEPLNGQKYYLLCPNLVCTRWWFGQFDKNRVFLKLSMGSNCGDDSKLSFLGIDIASQHEPNHT